MTTGPVACWIEIESTDGTKYGAIQHVIGWTSTAELSKAGKINFSVAATDPKAKIIQPKRVARCYAIIDDAITEIGAGIIDRVQYQIGINASTISCAGDDLLRELTYRSVHELQVYVETKAMPTKVWQFDGPSTYDDLTLTYDGTAPDGNQTTHEAFDLAATDSFLFIGYSEPFNVIYTVMGSDYYNLVESSMGYGYSTGIDPDDDWVQFRALDDEVVDVDGIPWNAALIGGTAATLFERPGTAWISQTINSTDAYWVRIDPSANVAPVDIKTWVLGIRGPSPTDVADVMAFAPSPAWDNWDAGTVTAGVYASTTDGVYASFSGETVLSALTKIAQRSGENFRLGPSRQLHWLRTLDADSGVTAVTGGSSIAINDNPNVCSIVSAEKIYDTYDLVTRVYPYGAGNGKARVTLINADFAVGAGYAINTAENYIESQSGTTDYGARAGTAEYGVIERVIAFKDARSISDTLSDTAEACNELAKLAYNWLRRHDHIAEYYKLSLVGCDQILQVGTTIRVEHREIRNGLIALQISGSYIILSASHTFSNGRIYTASIDIGTNDSVPATDNEIMASLIEQGTIYEAHPQPIDANTVRVI